MSTPQVPTIKIGLESAGRLMTPEEFDEITEYDDRYRYELLHGRLIVNPIPSEAEAGPNEELGYMWRIYRDQHAHGSSLDDTLPERYVRTADSRHRADRVIWAGLGRRPNPREDIPTIVVEFLSAAKSDRRRDDEEKRQEYLEAGVAEYWVIDRFARRMTVYRDRPGGEEQVVAEGEFYQTALLPGFELPVGRLLQTADDWPQS